MSGIEEAFTEKRTEKAGSTGDQDAFFDNFFHDANLLKRVE